MVALAQGDVGGWVVIKGVVAATAATSLDNCVERESESKSRCECKRVWEARGEELLMPLIKNNRIHLIIFGARWRR
jgi:hypothetical protein